MCFFLFLFLIVILGFQGIGTWALALQRQRSLWWIPLAMVPGVGWIVMTVLAWLPPVPRCRNCKRTSSRSSSNCRYCGWGLPAPPALPPIGPRQLQPRVGLLFIGPVIALIQVGAFWAWVPEGGIPVHAGPKVILTQIASILWTQVTEDVIGWAFVACAFLALGVVGFAWWQGTHAKSAQEGGLTPRDMDEALAVEAVKDLPEELRNHLGQLLRAGRRPEAVNLLQTEYPSCSPYECDLVLTVLGSGQGGTWTEAPRS